jgi:hypothetical protein
MVGLNHTPFLGLMSQGSATVKQRRRQWDPPNRPRPVVASPTTPQYLPSVQDLAAVDVTLTPAEEFALSALMGMAATQDSLTRNLYVTAIFSTSSLYFLSFQARSRHRATYYLR